jgi:hypothetical protein
MKEGLDALNELVDIVLAYRPARKQPHPKRDRPKKQLAKKRGQNGGE